MFGNNFYNPYMYQRFMNAASAGSRVGLGKGFFSNLFHKFNFNNFLTGASKTLNVVNQAIPIYYQVKPVITNAKTMFRVMNAVKGSDKNTNIKTNNYSNINNSVKQNYSNSKTFESNESPTFFI